MVNILHVGPIGYRSARHL